MTINIKILSVKEVNYLEIRNNLLKFIKKNKYNAINKIRLESLIKELDEN